ncbi:15250_t:CDS:2, partial [Dentiscutata heterogama]
ERHQHQREKYLVQQNPEKEKQEHKKNREQQRIAAKINWRKKGFAHLYQSKNEQLKNLLLHDISEHQALNDIKKIVAKSRYYSNKISETDNELPMIKEEKGFNILLMITAIIMW